MNKPMATDDENKAMKQLLAEAVADGLEAYRSKVEEAAAKAATEQKTADDKKPKGGDKNDGDSGFSFAGWLLGR